jgi:hypothetical protein
MLPEGAHGDEGEGEIRRASEARTEYIAEGEGVTGKTPRRRG